MASSDFERRITTGFKLLSGFYTGAISKPDLENLGLATNVEWGAPEFERLVEEAHVAMKRIGLIKEWRSWRQPLANAASDAVAMNFLLLVVKDWELKEGPTSTGSPRDRFEKNVRILFDRMVYEYVVGRWRGSSDSRIARNIDDLPTDKTAVLDPISEEDWKSLIDEVVDQGTIGGDPYTTSKAIPGSIKLLLFYYYCLSGLSGPDEPIEFDHIIPQRKFRKLTAEENAKYGHLMNNICNVAALPRGDNVAKSDKTLCDLQAIAEPADERDWLLGQVSKYTNLSQAELAFFCKASAAKQLQEKRGADFKKVFSTTRLEKLQLS